MFSTRKHLDFQTKTVCHLVCVEAERINHDTVSLSTSTYLFVSKNFQVTIVLSLKSFNQDCAGKYIGVG